MKFTDHRGGDVYINAANVTSISSSKTNPGTTAIHFTNGKSVFVTETLADVARIVFG